MRTQEKAAPLVTRLSDVAERAGISQDALESNFGSHFEITRISKTARSPKFIPTYQAEAFLLGLEEGGFDRAVIRLDAAKAERNKKRR